MIVARPGRPGARGDQIAAALFLAPFLVLLVTFHYVPLLQLVRDSLFDYELLNPARRKFVGLEKYLNLLTDPQIRQSFGVSFALAAGVVVTVLPCALLLALWLNGRVPARGLVRTVVFLPVVTSVVVVATMWSFLLNPANGLINSALISIGLPRQPFLTSANEALPTLVLVMLWQQLGFATVLYLAGLQAIPEQIEDAARVDGATRFQRFRYVTVPLLGRTTAFLVVIMTVFSLQSFAQPMIMTSGGPDGTTNFIVYQIYETAFSLQDPGLASALSLCLLVIVLMISAVQLRLLRTRWVY